jgi:hypothetical protein
MPKNRKRTPPKQSAAKDGHQPANESKISCSPIYSLGVQPDPKEDERWAEENADRKRTQR